MANRNALFRGNKCESDKNNKGNREFVSRPRNSRLSRVTANERAIVTLVIATKRKKKTLSREKSPCLARRGPWEGWKGNSLSGGGLSLLATWSGSFSRVLNERIFFASLREACSWFRDRRGRKPTSSVRQINRRRRIKSRWDWSARSVLVKSTCSTRWISCIRPEGRKYARSLSASPRAKRARIRATQVKLCLHG